jgi:hypothetical protein
VVESDKPNVTPIADPERRNRNEPLPWHFLRRPHDFPSRQFIVIEQQRELTLDYSASVTFWEEFETH